MKNTILALAITSIFSISMSAEDQYLQFEGVPDKPGSGKHIVLISGDEEYRTEESCPMLAKILSKTHGFDTTVLFAINPEGGFIDNQTQTNIPGTDHIAAADLVIIGTRFRNLPEDQLQPLADYLNAGKPIFGFRTATHGFRTKSKLGGIDWNLFGLNILGEKWAGHYGKHRLQGARGEINEAHKDHPALRGVGTIFAESDVYGVKPENVNDNNATILIHGIVTHSLDPESPAVPGKEPQASAWYKTYQTPKGTKEGTAFCTTFGSSCDLDDENLRRLFINVAYDLTGLEVPEKANVDYIDPFQPSGYANHRKSDYYKKLNLKPSDYGWGKSPQTGPNLDEMIKTALEKAGPAPQ